MKHSERSKNCVSYHVTYAEDNDMIWDWVGSILNTNWCLERPSAIAASFFSRPCQKWLVSWYHIYCAPSQRMILVKIVLFGIDHDTYNLRSIWFDLFIKRLIQGPGKSEWLWECRGEREGSVSTKWPLLFFSSNLRFCIRGVGPPLHHHPP